MTAADLDGPDLSEPGLDGLLIALTEALTAHVEMITNVANALLQMETNNREQHLEILRAIHQSAGNRVGVRKIPRRDT